jgi:hypothetical protein
MSASGEAARTPARTNLNKGAKPITGKYRGESQNWGPKYDEIINKRRFHKGFLTKLLKKITGADFGITGATGRK